MITKETVEDFFENVNKGDEFDTSEVLLWGYFFLDFDLSKLKSASEKLVSAGYRFVDIFEAEKENEEDEQEYYLHVEKIERHDVNSLHKRNSELYDFADANEIDSYDGFDVGNIINTESIVK